MSVLFIGGTLPPVMDKELLKKSKAGIDYSADIFQKKIIRALEECGVDYHVFSAALIGAYPMEYQDIRFLASDASDEKNTYVSFCNIWGYRNLSRARALFRAIKRFIKRDGGTAYSIIVYCAHEPYLRVAHYIKRRFPKSKICFIVPDLPQFMNLNEKRSLAYDVLKKYDIKKMKSHISQVDKFVILTQQMYDKLEIGDRPYSVVEGILETFSPQCDCIESPNKYENEIKIVYAGRLNTSFGIEKLVDQFTTTKNEKYRLILCGDGDARDYVQRKCAQDSRIDYRGQVSVSEAKEIIDSGHILVNPRPNVGEYTKYSFPSKTIEYLLTGKPVVMYRLDGMPKVYQEFIYEIQNNDIMGAVDRAVNCNTHYQKAKCFFDYAQNNLVITKIIDKFYIPMDQIIN